MRILLIVMILSSFVGPSFPTEKFYINIFHMEILAPIESIKAGVLSFPGWIFWITLLASKAGVISLLFLLHRNNFRKLLFWLPLIYICFSAWALQIIFAPLLIPFIILWFVCMYHAKTSREFNPRFK